MDGSPTAGPAARWTAPAKPGPARSRRALGRSAIFVPVVAVLCYFALPKLTEGRGSADVATGLSPPALVGALVLQLASLLAYTAMTRVTLPPEPRLRLFTLLRIQLATKATAHVVPGGPAAGGALGYRLLTRAGIAPTAAGFTLATIGLGSAVVLNLCLWAALLVYIPVHGMQPGYAAAVGVGVVLLLAAGVFVWLLLAGHTWTERVLRATAGRIPRVPEDAVPDAMRAVARRLEDLRRRPELVRRGTLWAAANWILDAASLWVILWASGHPVNPVDLMVAFGVAQVLAAVPVTPGGLGLVETALPGMLAALSGVPTGTAVIAVLAWRAFQFWMPIPLGALSYASLKLAGPARRARTVRPDQQADYGTGDGRDDHRALQPAGAGRAAGTT